MNNCSAFKIFIRDRLNHLFLRPDDAWSSELKEARCFDSFCGAFGHCCKQHIEDGEIVVALNSVCMVVKVP